ncbi:MAG: aminopeptidase [Clostridiales Family XIII bacterium]|jgi:leucyl aminopeptidase (aminopeptidase T)|nr:aminopeptidase [Clostridiales Family XIII bacterium]
MTVNRNIVEAAKKLIIDCLGTKQDEKLLIVADENTFDLGCGFAAAGRECGIETTFVEAPAQDKGEPPAPVAAAMEAADVEFLLTSMSYSHVNARIAATEKGARIASMPMMTTEIAENYLNADYPFIKKVSEKYAELLTGADSVRVVTEKGTDITLDISGRDGHADTGDLTETGALGNLPAGEAYLAPIEDKGTGTIVVDGCIAYVGPVEDELTLTLVDGRITDISGGKTAKNLRDFLKDKDGEATGIAEFGIGTNPGAKIIGHPLVDEKVWGTIHIAFGMNVSMGGTRQSDIHYDCIIKEPTVWVDGVMILDKGEHIMLD